MANRRISELQELAGLDLADQDLFTVVHVNEVDPTLKNRKLTISGTKKYLDTYYLPRTGGTISGAVVVQGDLTVSGSTNFSTATFTGLVTVGSFVVQSGATVSGTISGATITGTYVQGTNVNGVLGNFTTITGGTINVTSGNFLQKISGVTITGASGAFTSLTGQSITGTTVNVQTITGSGATFTTLTGNTAGFTTVTGTTVTGTAANFISGTFTTIISGAAITGNTAGFTAITGVTVTGTTANFATGNFSTSVSSVTVTGTSGQFTTVTGVSGGFTVITGATVTGITANFVTLSGTTVTGNAGQFTTLTGVNANFTNTTGVLVSGVTVKAATGVFANLQFSSATVSGDLTVLGTGYFQSGVSVTGTISGITVTGTSGQFTTVTGVSGGFTVVTGITVTGTTANFTTGNFSTLLSGVTIIATTGTYTSLTGTTTTGTTANFVTYNGASGVFTTFLSGSTITGTTVAATTGNFTSLTGVTTTGTTANFVTFNGASGIFTARVSGATVTGTTANFTSGNFISLSGTTTTVTSGVFSAGSATAPSVAVGTGTSNSPGIYSPGTDQLAISTSGTGRVFVNASGQVSIGTATAIGTLNLASTYPLLYLTDTDATGSARSAIGSPDGNLVYYANENNQTGGAHIFYRNGANESLRIDSSGNVGIGVTPSAWSGLVGLDISSYGGVFGFGNQVGIIGNAYYNTTFKYKSTGAATSYTQNTGEHRWYNAPSGTAGNTISFTQAMTLDASGRLGLGATSPQGTIHVKHATDANIFFRNGTAAGLSTGTIAECFNDAITATTPFYLRATSFQFGTDSSGTFVPRVTVTSGGLVGIGTTSPSYILDVAGTSATSSTIRVSTTATSDATIITKTSLGSFLFGTGIGTAAKCWNVYDLEATATRLLIDSSGRVGIGTTSPQAALHIGSGSLQMEWGSWRVISNFDNNYRQGLSFDPTNRQLRIFSTTNDTGGSIGFYTRVGAGSSDADYGTERARIDSSGNVGVGVTPSVSYGKELSISADVTSGVGGLGVRNFATGNNAVYLSNNAKNTGAFADSYWTTAPASKYQQNQGIHSWYTAASGTAGAAITFTQAMTLDASGRLGIGTTSPSEVLTVAGNIRANGTNAKIGAYAANSSSPQFALGNSAGTDHYLIYETIDGSGNRGTLSFYDAIAATIRVAIDSSGNVGVGTSTPYALLTASGPQTTSASLVATMGPILSFNSTNNADTTAVQTALSIARSGKSSVSYGNQVNFNLGRYSQTGSAAQTQLNIRLNNGNANDPDTDVMTLLASGQVLVGTTTRRTGLTTFVSGTNNTNADYQGVAGSFVGPGLVGTITNAATISVEDNRDMAIDVGGSIGFGGRYLTSNTAYAQWAAIAGKKSTGTSGEYGGYLGFYTRTHAIANIDERMRIDSSGRVGIGTTSPTNALHVVSTVQQALFEGATQGNIVIQKVGTSGIGLYSNAAGTLSFYDYNATTDRMKLDSSGRLLVGTSTGRSLFFAGAAAAQTQIEGNSTATASLSITRNDATADGNALILAKARSSAYAILQYVNGTTSDDRIGRISFQGADGTNMVPAASIEAWVDATPGASDMPGRLVFYTTADGSATPTERMRIDSNGFANYTGSIGRGSPVIKTSSFTVGIAENWLICNGISSITVTLPTASAWIGREIMFVNRAPFTLVSASLNVIPLGGTFGASAILAASSGKYATLVSDGTNWIIMQAN